MTFYILKLYNLTIQIEFNYYRIYNKLQKRYQKCFKKIPGILNKVENYYFYNFN